MEYRILKEEELNEWYGLVEHVFKVPSEYFIAHYENDPDKDINSIFVAVENDRLVGTVRVFHREIYHNDSVLKMGGIGEVCVLETHRNQGIASTLMKMSLDYMHQNNFEVSILVSELYDYYKRFGYESKGIGTKVVKVDGQPKKHYVIQELNSLYLDEIKALYDKHSSKVNGALVRRSMNYYHNWFNHELTKHDGCKVVIDNNDHLVGYIVYKIVNDILIVTEFICENNSSCFDSILSELIFEVLDKNSMNVRIPQYIPTSFKVLSEDTDYLLMYLSLNPSIDVFDDLYPHYFYPIDFF